MEDITEAPELVARVAALDIGKSLLTACVRVPHEDKPGRRPQEVRTVATTTRSLLELRDWLTCEGVTLCVLEATSVYWEPPFYLLEDGIECCVVNAWDVKNVPGRPKTGKLDAVWLCKLAERGCCGPASSRRRGSGNCGTCAGTAHPDPGTDPGKAARREAAGRHPDQALVGDQRHLGKSGRDMREALIAGQRDPYTLPQMARGSMRGKKSVLQEALTVHFRDHHGYLRLLRMMPDRTDVLTAHIEALTRRIEETVAPLATEVAQLDEIPGVGKTCAQELIAETGVGSRYHRLARRRGKQRALVAVGNSILVIVWHLPSDPNARFTDLGPG